MKLKLFEEFGDDELYQTISDDEWDSLVQPEIQSDNDSSFTQYELDILRIYFKGNIIGRDNGYGVKGNRDRDLSYFKNLKGLNMINLQVDDKDNYGYSILKCNDEWYYIFNKLYYNFYKCDTFEGVIQCLDDTFGLKDHIEKRDSIKVRYIGESANNRLYQQVSRDNWADKILFTRLNGYLRVDFTPKELSVIQGYFRGWVLNSPAFNIQVPSGDTDCKGLHTINIYRDKLVIPEFVLSKMTDEWYYILHNGPLYYGYYKCDTFDGVKQYLDELKDKNILNIIKKRTF